MSPANKAAASQDGSSCDIQKGFHVHVRLLLVQYVGPVQSTQVQITTTIASHSDDSPTCSIGRVHSGLNVLGLVDAPIWSQLDVFKFVESRVAISRVFFLEDRHLKLPILQFRRFFALSSLS